MAKAVKRSPISAISTTSATPSGLTISRLARPLLPKRCATRSRLGAIGLPPASRQEIAEPEYRGKGREGEAPHGRPDQLPQATLDQPGDEEEQHRSGCNAGGHSSIAGEALK